MTAPRITRMIPVARLRVFGLALLANLAPICAHNKVNKTQRTNVGTSGAPPMVK